MTDRHDRRLLAPVIGTGALMAAYLLLRPYSDVGASAAQAFASDRWVIAHLCGVGALASVARLGVRLADGNPSLSARIARWSGLVGVVLVLPYYGAETFALNVIGRAAGAGDVGALGLVDAIRYQPAAVVTFGAGLLALAVSGIASALTFGARHGRRGWTSYAAWPLGIGVATVLPQFYLPASGRMAFGMAYAAAAGLLAAAILRDQRSGVRSERVDGGRPRGLAAEGQANPA